MSKNILLPIDLNHSTSWRKALPEAVAQIRAFGGKLHILTVVPDFGMSIVGEFFPEDFKENALRKAASELAGFAEKHVPREIDTETHIAYGATVVQILATANAVSADLIVMASHQPDHLRDFLVGSNADRIVHASPISVLVTRG